MLYKRWTLIATALIIILVASRIMLSRMIGMHSESQSIWSLNQIGILPQISHTKTQSPDHEIHHQLMGTYNRLEPNHHKCSEHGDGRTSGVKSRVNNTRKVEHIMFLKVHKAGSTTMENIFFRFGIGHNLTFVLPKTGVYVLAGGDSDDILPVTEGAHYDILACHSVYNATKMARVLPSNSVKIGIIREPLDRMVSAAYYYRDRGLPYLLEVPKENFILNLIRKQSIYEKNEFSRTKNSMAKDFGFPGGLTANMTNYVSDYISRLATQFKLVLVMEKFEESLILMKRFLNWDMFDILFIAANSHKHDPIQLKPDDLAKFKAMCFLDYAIYERFLMIFELKIQLEGDDFKEEVAHFKRILDSVKKYCCTDSIGEVLKIDGSRWNCPFIVTGTDCRVMKMDVSTISLPILRNRHIKMHGLTKYR